LEYFPTKLATSAIEIFKFIKMTPEFINNLKQEQIEIFNENPSQNCMDHLLGKAETLENPTLQHLGFTSPHRYDSYVEDEGIEWVLRHIFLDLPLFVCPNNPLLKPIDGGGRYTFITKNCTHNLSINYGSSTGKMINATAPNGDRVVIGDVKTAISEGKSILTYSLLYG